jgi:tetratricopeptide (TPR) repeat protein
VGNLPPGADCFQERPEQDALIKAFRKASTVVVFAGMGGVGKTQLAADFANAQWHDRAVDLLVWVNASSPLSIISDYATAAKRIGVTTSAEATDLAAANRFRSWLAEKRDKKWLIVLDDVADANDLTRLKPPLSDWGHTVVTTRQRDPSYYAKGWRLLEVGIFNTEQAREYLGSRLSDHPDALTGADELAADLGYLPLALAFASAIIRFNADAAGPAGGPRSCAEYRAVLADRRRTLRELSPDTPIDDYEGTLAAIWLISIDRVDQRFPSGIGRRLMELLSLLDPNGIPLEILDAPVIHDYLGSRSADEIRTVLETLQLFSLIEFAETGSDLIRVHMLVQRAVRETTGANLDAAARALADSMASQWPAQQHSADLARLLRSNALALYTADPGPLQDPGLHPLLVLLGNSYGMAGLVDQAHDYFTGLLQQTSAALGADSRDTLHARQREAYWLGFRGKTDQALPVFEALAADQARVLGPDDRDTLISRHNIARFRGRSGDPRGAVEDLRRLIADEERALGATDIETLKSRNILGYWLNLAGDPEDAVAELEAVLPLNVGQLGPDHDETLRARNDLAMAMAATGDYPEAIAEGERVVRDRIRVLGAKDPATLSSRAYLAHWRTLAGQDSLADLRAIVADHETVLGDRQPNTLRARTYYVEALYLAAFAAGGDVAEAIAEMQHHLEITREVLGPTHILTTRCEQKLREWRGGA